MTNLERLKRCTVNIRISSEKLHRDQLQSQLQQVFPACKIRASGKRNILISKNAKVGVRVKVRSGSISIDPCFPTRTGRIYWLSSLVVLGTIIPLVVYGIVRHKAMKNFEQEVEGVIKELA